MPTRRRKIEVHRLTISGLVSPNEYAAFLSQLHGRVGALKDTVWERGEKSHGLHEASVHHARLRLLFFTFTTGYRPDILDTEAFSIQPNPLAESQTGIEWTHVLGGVKNDRFLLVLEKSQPGIWPSVIEGYLQWLIDEYFVAQENEEQGEDGDEQEPLTVSVEAEPGEEFIRRLDALDRITKATVRTVRPNPGWADLQTELGAEATESDAHKAEVVMTARRKESLRKDRGIIAAIKRLFRARTLNHASIEGELGSEKESFSTERLGRQAHLTFNLDERGQVQHADAWNKLGQMFDQQD